MVTKIRHHECVAALPRCHVAALPRCRITTVPLSIPRCRGPAVPRCRGAAVPRCRVAALPRCRAAALPRCRTAALPRCRIADLLRYRVAALPFYHLPTFARQRSANAISRIAAPLVVTRTIRVLSFSCIAEAAMLTAVDSKNRSLKTFENVRAWTNAPRDQQMFTCTENTNFASTLTNRRQKMSSQMNARKS